MTGKLLDISNETKIIFREKLINSLKITYKIKEPELTLYLKQFDNFSMDFPLETYTSTPETLAKVLSGRN